MPKRQSKKKKGGASTTGISTPQVFIPPPPPIPAPTPPPFMPIHIQPFPQIPMPPQHLHDPILYQRRLLKEAIAKVKNHDYYVYQPPRVPTAMNLEVGKEDIIMPPTRRPARKGDHKYIGNSENTVRGGSPNSQRALARKFGMDDTALIDLNVGIRKIRNLKYSPSDADVR